MQRNVTYFHFSAFTSPRFLISLHHSPAPSPASARAATSYDNEPIQMLHALNSISQRKDLPVPRRRTARGGTVPAAVISTFAAWPYLWHGLPFPPPSPPINLSRPGPSWGSCTGAGPGLCPGLRPLRFAIYPGVYFHHFRFRRLRLVLCTSN